MAGTFFELETAIPPGLDDDPGHGMDDEEEAYDALNDETFGEAVDDDWENNHEQLAKVIGGNQRRRDDFNDHNHNHDHDEIKNQSDLEASLSQLVLEDSDDFGIHRRSTRPHLPHPSLVPYQDSPSSLRNSVWSVGKHDVPSPISSSSPLRPRPALPPVVQNVCTVEELERNLLQMRAGGVSNAPIGPPGSGSALRLEDVERKMTQGGVPQPRINLSGDLPSRFPPGLGRGNLLASLQNARAIGTPGRIEPPKVPLQQLPIGFNNANLPPHLNFHQQHTFQPIHPGPGMLQLGPHHQQQQQQQQQQQHLPFNINGPRIPPFHMNNQHLPHPPHQPQMLQHPPHPQHQQHSQHRPGGNNMFHQHHNYHHQGHQHNNYQNNQHSHHQQHRVNGAGDYDEYAGLMTPWQKQWLLNIQTLQLNVGIPYVVDYYYTVFKSRTPPRSDPEKSNNTSIDRVIGRPDSVRGGRERPESTKPGRERPPSVMGPAKAYTPLQFENSLGKLQCVSVTAPRKLIDMEVMSPEGSDGQSSQRDLRKTKQLMLEIERLYVLLLELEDAYSPLALHAAAEAAANRILRDPPDTEPEPVKTPPEELIQRMSSFLLQGDKISGFMGIRKGKTLLLRLLPHIAPDSGLHTAFWGQVLVGLYGLVRRDQSDGLLPCFLRELKRWLEVCALPLILKLTTALVAEASPKPKSNKTAIATAVNSKFGVSALTAILSATEKLLPTMSEEQGKRWVEFMSAVAFAAETIRSGDDSTIQPSLPLSSSTLQTHLDHCGPSITNKQAALFKRLFVTDSGVNNVVKTESVISPDKNVRRSADSTANFLIK